MSESIKRGTVTATATPVLFVPGLWLHAVDFPDPDPGRCLPIGHGWGEIADAPLAWLETNGA
jgi:hypothetical protein